MDIISITMLVTLSFIGGISMLLHKFFKKFKNTEIKKENREVRKSGEKPPQTCHKEKFNSKIEADKIIALYSIKQKKNKTTHRKESRSYFCEECQAWHLTSKEKTLKESEK